jgi:hypothetical protein
MLYERGGTKMEATMKQSNGVSTEHRIVDADGHVIVSDSELLHYLPEPYRDREDILGYPIFPSVYGFNPAAARIADGKGRNVVRTSPEGWTEFLNASRIEWSVLYPTAGLAHGLIKDRGWATATAQAYNNFFFARYHSAFNEVRREFLGSDFPTSTMVQVVALARPELLLEINAVAIVPESAVKDS